MIAAMSTAIATRTPAEAREHLELILSAVFRRAAELLEQITLQHAGVGKASGGELPPHAEALLAKLNLPWSALAAEVEDDLETIAQAGGEEALTALGIDDGGMLSSVNRVASDWASKHSAKLVSGIADTTRDQLRGIVADAFESGSSIQELARDIRTAGAFSEQRAELIAETEASRASQQGNVLAWKESGQVQSLHFVLSADHSGDDECDDAAAGSPYDVDDPDLPDVPLHPNCYCSLIIASLADRDEE
jgi:SPP1 gp7 family putative phage head morphogenesis protein